jgi:hypothetical protein
MRAAFGRSMRVGLISAGVFIGSTVAVGFGDALAPVSGSDQGSGNRVLYSTPKSLPAQVRSVCSGSQRVHPEGEKADRPGRPGPGLDCDGAPGGVCLSV